MSNLELCETKELVQELHNRLDRLILFGYKELGTERINPIVALKGSVIDIYGLHSLFKSHLDRSLADQLENPFDGISDEDFV